MANTGRGWGERYRVEDSEADLFPNWSYYNHISPGEKLYLGYVSGSLGPYEIKVIPVVPLASSEPVKSAAIDLAGNWELEEGNGTVAINSSNNSNVGKLMNGPTWSEGRTGQALIFDGRDDLVEVKTNQWNADQGTISLWAKARSFSKAAGQASYLFGHTTQPPYGNRIQLYVDDSEGYLDLGLGDSHTTHTNIMKLATDKWHHLALTWDGTRYVVYVDGEQ